MAAHRQQTGQGMSPHVDAPLPLITVDSKGKFVIGTESLNLIKQIKGDIAVVAVAGIYRFVTFFYSTGSYINHNTDYDGSAHCSMNFRIQRDPLAAKYL